MKRFLLIAAIASGTVLVGAGPASGDAPPNANNCLGTNLSSLNPAPKVFGPSVKTLAQGQFVDNVATGDFGGGNASCGDNNSNNP